MVVLDWSYRVCGTSMFVAPVVGVVLYVFTLLSTEDILTFYSLDQLPFLHFHLVLRFLHSPTVIVFRDS